MTIACGGCLGCRKLKAAQWALRCRHEAELHDASSFITLTYADAHYPDDGCIDVRTVQLFMKRLRKQLGRCRFFLVGEYGGRTWRAHYHALIFGQDFAADRRQISATKRGEPIYTSQALADVWPYGFHTIGSVSHASAGYVAAYSIKKIGGPMADSHYRRFHPVTGKTVQLTPEFALMSRRPGLGAAYLDKYRTDYERDTYTIVDGRKVPVPLYYRNRLDPQAEEKLRSARIQQARRRAADNTPERLETRAEHMRITLEERKRNAKDPI